MKLNNLNKRIYIDPPTPHYYKDKLFDMSDRVLNRDDNLKPFLELKNEKNKNGIDVHTADFLINECNSDVTCDYYSLGILENYSQLIDRKGVHLKAFVIFEPPIVNPEPYEKLADLTAAFERVYLYNTVGDGYSLKDVDTKKLRQLFWPQSQRGVIEEYWKYSDRLNRIVIINGNHIPRKKINELYSRRIEAIADLSHFNAIDLYGRGWNNWFSRSSMWLPYWKNRKALIKVYKGECESKYKVLSQYNFSLCFENMIMRGYITEKIFDCFYSGTIPIYLGASDIESIIPDDIYIDCRKFDSWKEIFYEVRNMHPNEIKRMREKARKFIKSKQGEKYINSLHNIFD